MNIKTAKQLDMVDYLAQLGHHPTRVQHPSYWYRSPLREEKTASFKVNRKTNTWIDFATNEKGNLVDFGVEYFKCDESAFLQRLSGPGQTHTQHRPPAKSETSEEEDKKKIRILAVYPIVALPLIRYYRERHIADKVAQKYLQEAVYELYGKNYYALAFGNDRGGYELRNKYFKGSSSPKDSTYIDNGSSHLAVFEGSFNFLSHRTIFLNQPAAPSNFLILNSTSFFESKLPLMLQHEKVDLFLDNDATGQKCSQRALAIDSQRFQDQRSLYQGYNDLNDWHMHIGKRQQPQVRQSP